jgi:hypothetical protein
MTRFEIRKRLFEKLTPVDEKALPKFYTDLIDESIDSVLDGSTTIDGNKAITLDDAVRFTMVGMKSRIDVWEQFKTAVSSAFPADEVTVNYRGSTVKVKKNN